jgi:hypothetical protein
MPVQLTAVVPQPRIDLRSADGETGEPVRATTYRGVVVLEFRKEGAFSISTVPETNHFSFFVPDSVAYEAGQEGVAAATVSVALQPISGGQMTASGPYGVHSCTAQLVDDPRGTAVRWLQLAFVNTYATMRAEVSYEATVVVPLPRD